MAWITKKKGWLFYMIYYQDSLGMEMPVAGAFTKRGCEREIKKLESDRYFMFLLSQQEQVSARIKALQIN